MLYATLAQNSTPQTAAALGVSDSMHLRRIKVMKLHIKLIFLLTLSLYGCGDEDNESKEEISSVSIAEIVADIESGGSMYDGVNLKISGEYLYNIPSISCDGFCLTQEEISGLEQSDLNFVNTYGTYSTNLCDTMTNEIKADGYSIAIHNFPLAESDIANTFDCDFSTGDIAIGLSGTLEYTTVVDYCNLIEQPSARLYVDTDTVEKLGSLVNCE